MKPRVREARKNYWIMEATWRLVYTRVSACRYLERYQSLIRCLARTINTSLKAYRRWRTEETGGEIETLLTSYPPLHKEPWHRMNRWYKAVVYRAPPLFRLTLEQITVERIVLYFQLKPPGENIPKYVEPFQVEDLVPTEDEIE